MQCLKINSEDQFLDTNFSFSFLYLTSMYCQTTLLKSCLHLAKFKSKSDKSEIMIVLLEKGFFFEENFTCTAENCKIMMTCVGVLNFCKSWRASVIPPCNFENQHSSFRWLLFLFISANETRHTVFENQQINCRTKN